MFAQAATKATSGAGAATFTNAATVSSTQMASTTAAEEARPGVHYSQSPFLQGPLPQNASSAPSGLLHNLPDLELNNYEEIDDAFLNWNLTGPLWLD
jgi:hypothetical protein